MRIIFLSDEVAPYSGSGIGSRVCGSLSKALRGRDHQVTVVCPLFQSVDPDTFALARRLSTIDIDHCGETIKCTLFDGRSSAGVQVVFIGEDRVFGKVDSLEEDDTAFRAAERTAIFGKAAAELMSLPTMKADVVHAHSWTGLVPLLVGPRVSCPRVLTLPHASVHGTFPGEDAKHFDLPASAEPVNIVAHSLPLLSHIVAPSVGAASLFVRESKDFTTSEPRLAERVSGILHGIDTNIWNPATDPLLARRYDPFDQSGKASCKAAFQSELGLPVCDDPLLAFVEWEDQISHMAHGEDLRGILAILPDLLRNPAQIVIRVANGDDELLRELESVQNKWPDKFRVIRSRADEDVHRILAASDLNIVSDAPEWSSFVCMYGHRYGSMPIACQSSRYDDVVVDCDSSLVSGTGFVCRRFDEDDLLAACRRAIGAYQDHQAFAQLRTRAMKLDWSWERSARLHESIYRQCLGANEQRPALDDAAGAQPPASAPTQVAGTRGCP